jgi:hypothetical protein
MGKHRRTQAKNGLPVPLVKTLNRDRIVRSGALVGVPVPFLLRGNGSRLRRYHYPERAAAKGRVGEVDFRPSAMVRGCRLDEKVAAPSVTELTDQSEPLTEAPRRISQLRD